jgi:ABC-2 type transport system ATP-binding protein
MAQALEAANLGKRYGHTWALRDCTFHIPVGCIAGLVGPNGAGKTTLLHLAMGLLRPTQGNIRILGSDPVKEAARVLPNIGLVSQEHPLYKNFSVEDMLTWGKKLNPRWDQNLAMKRLEHLGIPLKRLTGKLSGGQQAQVALILALAKRPELLILDEPVASLDPLARHEFQQILMDVVREQGLTVIISSHIVADLERFCDYLVVLSASHVQTSCKVDELLQVHKWIIAPREEAETLAKTFTILQSQRIAEQCKLLVHAQHFNLEARWKEQDASLEEIILAYLALPLASIPGSGEKLLEVAG